MNISSFNDDGDKHRITFLFPEFWGNNVPPNPPFLMTFAALVLLFTAIAITGKYLLMVSGDSFTDIVITHFMTPLNIIGKKIC